MKTKGIVEFSCRTLARAFLCSAFILPVALPASAVTVNYNVSSLGGNQYEYVYEILNDDLATGIGEFAMYFDLDLYQDLVVTASPQGWDSIVFQPDPLLPDDGIFDSLALDGPSAYIGLGETLYGFSVSFTWLGGSALPGAQAFDIVDPATFEVVASGETTAVPLPAAGWLLVSGLIGLAGAARTRRHTI